MGVSRETPPAGADVIFGDHLEAMEAYADLLAGDGVERGLIGPREVPRLWERHLLNCAVVSPRLPQGAAAADVGTGAGLPGLVWAIMRPDVTMTLIEPLLRRTTFLEEVADRLGLQNVVVLRSRAEDVEAQFDVVTARAVANMDKLARWTMPLVRDGGVLLALKGQSAQQEVDDSRRTLGRLGAKDVIVRTYGDLEIPTTVVEVTKR